MPKRTSGTTHISKNIEQTNEIAKIFLEKLLTQAAVQSSKREGKNKGATVVGLIGDLGAGKTTFIQSVALYLGIKDRVRSPTFVIMKKYSLKNKKYDFLFHLDAYRLKDEKELLALGWEEIVSSERNLVFIEWPQNVSKAMPSHAKFIYISDDKDEQKHFKFK
jgi:tRNA threonylcarbamoyladenosine biosynthesis protein TsaE